jgi:hypothetical protein
MPVVTRARSIAITTALACELLAASPASAACPVEPGIDPLNGTVSSIDPSARLSFIVDRMDLGARRALAWSLGWGLTYGAAAVTQIAITPVVGDDVRVGLYVGSVSATIGTVTRAVNIPHVIRERRRLRRYLAGESDVCASWREAERALLRSARWERRNTRLLLHFAALTYSVAAGLVIAVGFERPIYGHRQLAIGATVGQLMMVTTPTIALQTLGTYRQGSLRRMSALHTFPLLLPGGAGFAIGGAL